MAGLTSYMLCLYTFSYEHGLLGLDGFMNHFVLMTVFLRLLY